MRIFGRLAALAALPLLAGCVDLTTTLSVTRDGTATVVTEIAIESDMMAMVEAQAGESEEEFCPEEIPELPPSFTSTTERLTVDDQEVCRVTAIGPIDELAELLETAAITPDADDMGAPEAMLIDEGGGVYTYVIHLEIPASEELLGAAPGGAALTPEQQAQQQQMMAMMAGMMEGHFIRYSLTAPRIIAVEGGEQDGNTVTYEIPLGEFLSVEGATYDFSVTFGL